MKENIITDEEEKFRYFISYYQDNSFVKFYNKEIEWKLIESMEDIINIQNTLCSEDSEATIIYYRMF
jgi:hypothetical protein